MNEAARCTEPASESNARGGQHAPRAAASYDAAGRRLRPRDRRAGLGRGRGRRLESRGSVAPATLGEESWKWLFLQPLLTQE